MVVNSAVHMKSDRILTILPIAFSYEQIAEEKSYAKELSGKSKQKESVSGVLKALKILKKRYGKVYMRVGEPIYLNEIDWLILKDTGMRWKRLFKRNIPVNLPRRSCTVLPKYADLAYGYYGIGSIVRS